MDKIEIYKHLSWKIKYEAWDMTYPAISFWKLNISITDIIKSWEKQVYNIKKNGESDNLWLYIHIPFCYTRCFFCCCFTAEEKNSNKYDEYLDCIEKESQIFTNIFDGIKFSTVYVWWWTPTILSAKQLDRFYKILKKYFNLSEAVQIMIEWSPYTTTEDKIVVLSSHWVNKMTFWVQSLDLNTLKKNNRLQRIWDVKKAMILARKYWIKYINIDIMAWIPDQDFGSFVETLKHVEELNPTTIQVNWFLPNKATEFAKSWQIYSFEDIELRNNMVKYWKYLGDRESKIIDNKKKNWQVNEYHGNNGSILWLWYWAISHSFWGFHYTKNSFEEYKDCVNWNNNIKFFWFKLDINDEIITYLISNLRRGVEYSKFKILFWCELKDLEIYKNKLLKLINKWILIEFNNCQFIKFRIDSNLYTSIYSKVLYNDNIIVEFVNYMKTNKDEFKNLDLRLKQFFTD